MDRKWWVVIGVLVLAVVVMGIYNYMTFGVLFSADSRFGVVDGGGDLPHYNESCFSSCTTSDCLFKNVGESCRNSHEGKNGTCVFWYECPQDPEPDAIKCYCDPDVDVYLP